MKKLCEGTTSLDKMLIRNMAEGYYFIDDVAVIIKKIMQQTGNRHNPKIVSDIVNKVKSKERVIC